RVDPDDAPAPAHQRGEVTGDSARAAAHLEDHVPGADGNEAQEPAPETRVARGARPQLERRGELDRGGLRVDITPGVGAERGRGQAMEISRWRRAGGTRLCRSNGPRARPPALTRAMSRRR